jgi:hypothetical protein
MMAIHLVSTSVAFTACKRDFQRPNQTPDASHADLAPQTGDCASVNVSKAAYAPKAHIYAGSGTPCAGASAL